MHRSHRSLIGAAAVLASVGTAILGSAAYSAPASPAANSVPSTASVAKGKYKTLKLTMVPSSKKLAACYPKARATAYVALTTDLLGFDTVTVRASGLRPRTQFTLFFLEHAGNPFGAAEYFGDFSTDKYGYGQASFRLIAEEAFALDVVRKTRTDLNSMGFWFADEKADDKCLGTDSPVTPFDGDGKAGVQMMNTGSGKLP